MKRVPWTFWFGVPAVALLALFPACTAKPAVPPPGGTLTPEQLRQVDLVEIADQQGPLDIPPEQLQRMKRMKFLGADASLTILPVRIRGNEEDAASAVCLAKMITDAGMCKARPAGRSLLLKAPLDDPNEMNKLLGMAREFRDYVRRNPPDTDYVLYADYVLPPQSWDLFMLHFVVCDRQGEWVIVDMQNSDHADFHSIAPKSREDCGRLVVKRLESCLGRPDHPAAAPPK